MKYLSMAILVVVSIFLLLIVGIAWLGLWAVGVPVTLKTKGRSGYQHLTRIRRYRWFWLISDTVQIKK